MIYEIADFLIFLFLLLSIIFILSLIVFGFCVLNFYVKNKDLPFSLKKGHLYVSIFVLFLIVLSYFKDLFLSYL